MRRWAVCMLILLGGAALLTAGDEALRIRKALKGMGSVEKVVVLQGKEAVHEGKSYETLVKMTVTTRYAALQGDALQDFRKGILGVVKQHVKGGHALLIIQSEKELTYDAWPF